MNAHTKHTLLATLALAAITPQFSSLAGMKRGFDYSKPLPKAPTTSRGFESQPEQTAEEIVPQQPVYETGSQKTLNELLRNPKLSESKKFTGQGYRRGVITSEPVFLNPEKLNDADLLTLHKRTQTEAYKDTPLARELRDNQEAQQRLARLQKTQVNDVQNSIDNATQSVETPQESASAFKDMVKKMKNMPTAALGKLRVTMQARNALKPGAEITLKESLRGRQTLEGWATKNRTMIRGLHAVGLENLVTKRILRRKFGNDKKTDIDAALKRARMSPEELVKQEAAKAADIAAKEESGKLLKQLIEDKGLVARIRYATDTLRTGFADDKARQESEQSLNEVQSKLKMLIPDHLDAFKHHLWNKGSQEDWDNVRPPDKHQGN